MVENTVCVDVFNFITFHEFTDSDKDESRKRNCVYYYYNIQYIFVDNII